MKIIVIDVKEPKETAQRWAKKVGFTFPVLLDDGTVAAAYALPNVLPDLPRDQTVIAANLLIDREGKIRFYSLLDTASFDAKLIAITRRLDELLAK